MRTSFRASLTTFAASAFVIAILAPAAAQTGNAPPMPSSTPRMQHWAADHAALLDAKLAGLKAGLKLNPDQEKLWGPFEAAVRSAAEMRMRHMMGRMERMRGGMGPEDEEEEGGPASPVDRLEAMADHLSEAADAIKKVADAAKPLYASLDDTQKRMFGMLGREMMMVDHGHGGMMGGHHRHRWGGPPHELDEGPDEEQ